MNPSRIIPLMLFTFTYGITLTANGQEYQRDKMANLSYMIGDWVGISTSIKEGKVDKQVPAFERIEYQLDSSIIEINLKSETLVLHTIIHYSVQDSTYYYQPFSKTGTGKYKAFFDGKRLIVSPHQTVRYIFTTTADGHFIEYGERLKDEKWVKYFEDTFTLIE